MIGISEMLMMTGICGLIFSLFSCQPIAIIGATGPVVVFERALVSVSPQVYYLHIYYSHIDYSHKYYSHYSPIDF